MVEREWELALSRYAQRVESSARKSAQMVERATVVECEWEIYVKSVESSLKDGQVVPDDFFRKALEEIVASFGQVCAEFEVCAHASCSGSVGAYLTAEYALCVAKGPADSVVHDRLPF